MSDPLAQYVPLLHERGADLRLEEALRQRIGPPGMWLLEPQGAFSGRVQQLLDGAFSGLHDGYPQLQTAEQQLLNLAKRVATRRSAAEWLVLWGALESVLDSQTIDDERKFRESKEIGRLYHLFREVARGSHKEVDPRHLRQMPSHRPADGIIEDLASLIKALYEVHTVQAMMRRVAKGQEVTFWPDGSYAHRDLPGSRGIGAAIDLFDRRRAVAFPQAGASLGAAGDVSVREDDADLMDLVPYFCSLSAEPGLPPAGVRQALREYEPWFVWLVSLRRLAPGYYGAQRLERDAGVDAIHALLNVVLEHIRVGGRAFPPPAGTWSRYGYVQLNRRELARDLEEALIGLGHDARVARHAANELVASKVICCSARADVLIDLAAASSALQDRHIRAREGSEANLWGEAFEQQLQDQIDRTPCRPSEELRRLRGKTLRHLPSTPSVKGTFLTDIDAVAVIDNTLLLVDCKSYPSTDGVRLGDPAETERLRMKVEENAQAWKDKIDYLADHPQVLHATIPNGMSIEGIVIVPDVLFVHCGVATEKVAGLYRVASVGEFHARILSAPQNRKDD